jgi:hypothetical protein
MIEKIGPYTITRELGRGGMGVVYLATDQRLDRQVAIKALPEHLAGDPDRLARFQREARVLASLNHPNVAGIHGLEESAGQHYLVLEFVEGESLDAVLERGPMPIPDAIDTAIAIAIALEAAHEKGIVHRDLKPANIMLTTEGVPKVLDFGLARQSEAGSTSTAISPDSPTLTSPAIHSPTIPGAIMGTAGYMSPEQARGRQVDKRSDIFSFGCVLYELLTGAKPFAGDTIADVLGATLHKDLDLSLLPAATPPNVRRVLARCLAKDKRQRLHDIADARIELQTPEAAPATAQPDPGRRSLIPLVVGAMLLAAAGAGAAWLAKPGATPPAALPPAPPPVVLDADILLPAGQRLGHAFQPGVAISDDGAMIVFPVNPEPAIDADSGVDRAGWAASTGLMLRRLDSPALTPVVGTEPESFQPVFSPDGRWIAYVSGRADLMKIPASGGRPVRLATAPAPIVGLDWHTDGFVYFGLRTDGGIHRVAENGGQPEAVTTPDRAAGERAHAMPAVLPDGGVLVTVYRSDVDDASIAFAPAPGKPLAQLARNASHARFANAHVLFAREGALFALPFTPDAPATTADPIPLPERVVHAKYYGNTLTMSHAAQFDLSPSGTLVIAEGGVPGEASLAPVWVDAQGAESPIDLEPRSYLVARTATETGRLYFMSSYGATGGLWSHEPDRGITQTIMRTKDIWFAPGPGPEEITLLLPQEDALLPALGVIDTEAGPKSFRPITLPNDLEFWPAEWSPDRRFLIGVGRSILNDQTSSTMQVWVYERDAGVTRLTDSDNPIEGWPDISPDGRWVIYAAPESGRLEIYVRPFNRPGPARRVTTEGGLEPRWSPDGSRIFFREHGKSGMGAGRTVFSVDVSFADTDPDRIILARPVERYRAASEYVGTVPIASWDFAPDGRAIFMKREEPADRHAFMSELFPARLRVIHNWAARLAP